MFGKRKALFKQNRVVSRVKKNLYSFQHLSFFLFSGLLPYSFTADGEAIGKMQGFGLHL